MYSYIKGKVVDKNLSIVTIDNNGIGYEINVTDNTLCDVQIGDVAKIYTYLYVREDEMSLFGFSKAEEKKLFIRLISISGIGPRMALQILSGMDLKSLVLAISSGDLKTLCKIKGLGKKTAELVILNLKDDMATNLTSMDDSGNVSMPLVSDDIVAAVGVLESLGIPRTEGLKAATDASKEVSGVENIISYCLKKLG